MTTPVAPAPAGATATSAQMPAPQHNGNGANGKSQLPVQQPGRDDKGRFAPQEGPAQGGPPLPKAKLRIRDLELDEDAAYNEITRARQATRMLTAAQKSAAEAAELRKVYDAQRAKAKAGDESALDEFLSELSPDERKALLTKHVYSRFVEPEQLTPEQRELLEERQKRTAAEKQLAEHGKKAEEAEQKRERTEAIASLRAEILAAMESGRIPNAPGAIRRIAAKLDQFERRGLSLPLDEAARMARSEVGEETGEFAEAASIDDLRDLWGPERFTKVSAKWLHYFREKAQQQHKAAAPPRGVEPRTQARKHMTPQEFENMQRKGGR